MAARFLLPPTPKMSARDVRRVWLEGTNLGQPGPALQISPVRPTVTDPDFMLGFMIIPEA